MDNRKWILSSSNNLCARTTDGKRVNIYKRRNGYAVVVSKGNAQVSASELFEERMDAVNLAETALDLQTVPSGVHVCGDCWAANHQERYERCYNCNGRI